MDIPDLVQRALGDEEIQAGVSLGDEDAVCLTPTRTLVYNGEGILSDEQVEEYSHDVEGIYVKDGRRKRKFVLEYIDGTRSFSVPASRGEKVLELLLEGVLRLESVIEPRESLVGVYLFSELTLVVAEGRVVKHIGEPVWDDDYEVYPFEDVTGLDFERASVATSIVLDIDGRPRRVKVPNDNAPVVRQALEKALFAFFDVGSVEELNRVVGAEDDAAEPDPDTSDDDLAFGSGIDPLVTDDEEADPLEDTADAFTDESSASETEADAGASSVEADAANTDTGAHGEPDHGTPAGAAESTPEADGTTGGVEEAAWSSPGETDASTGDGHAPEDGEGGDSEDRGGATADSAGDPLAAEPRDTADGDPDGEELAAVADRLEELTEAVDKQNDLLRRQHRAIKQLVRELQTE